jgi:hypothetical protein
MAEVKITNKLLKEAVLDAEMLVATAVENAKISLEETFTPQIKSMLSRRLRAEAEGMDDEEENVEKDAPEAEEAPKAAPKATPKVAATAPKMEAAKELPFQDGEPEGSSEMPADTSAIGSGDNKEPSDDAFASADDDMSGEDAGESDTDWYDDWSDADFDLKEVIAELEQDIQAFEKNKEEEPADEESEEETADEAYPDEEPVAGTKKPQIPADSSKIGKDENADMAANVDKFVNDPSVPKMEGEEEMHNHEEDEEEMHGHEKGEEELDLDEILKELEAADMEKQQKELEMSDKMAHLQKELAQYRAVVERMRGHLHEVNLLNAKLLYTNKIFRKEGLNDQQKIMVVENFDRATSVREVKMVYTVLVETLTSAARVVKATKTTKKMVAEGLASKATPSTAPKTPAKEVIAENSVAKRLQQLAGIIS